MWALRICSSYFLAIQNFYHYEILKMNSCNSKNSDKKQRFRERMKHKAKQGWEEFEKRTKEAEIRRKKEEIEKERKFKIEMQKIRERFDKWRDE